MIDGEPLPAPAAAAERGSGFSPIQFLNPFNPFVIIGVLVLGGVFRSVLGRLFGSIATGGLVGVLAWFIFGSLILSAIAGVIASVFTMFSDSITRANSARKRRVVRRLRRVILGQLLRRQQFERQRRVQRRRRQFRRRRRVGKLVGELAGMGIRRIGKHLLEHRWRVRRIFHAGRAGGDRAGDQGGRGHAFRTSPFRGGGRTRRRAAVPRSIRRVDRALDIFSQLRIWDTAHNNGVLIYLLFADHNVEIVADRGIDAKVGSAGWKKICADMEAEFKRANFEGGVIGGIEAVSRELARYFPAAGRRAE